MSLFNILITISTSLLLFGTVYAIVIYYHPFRAGWTWVSVVIGVFFTGAHEMVAIFYTISMDGNLYWIVIYPVIAFSLSGIPMIIGQVAKHINQSRQAHHVINSNLKEENGNGKV